MPPTPRERKLRARMPDESTIDLDEHSARIAAVVENGKQTKLPPPGARPELLDDLRPSERVKKG